MWQKHHILHYLRFIKLDIVSFLLQVKTFILKMSQFVTLKTLHYSLIVCLSVPLMPPQNLACHLLLGVKSCSLSLFFFFEFEFMYQTTKLIYGNCLDLFWFLNRACNKSQLSERLGYSRSIFSTVSASSMPSPRFFILLYTNKTVKKISYWFTHLT